MCARVVVREIADTDDRSFRPAWDLLRNEFPRAEMLPLKDWRNAMRERREGLWLDVAWHLLVAERDGDVVGAASGSYLGNINAGVIGYVAVSPTARSLGIGPRLRRTLLKKFDTDARSLDKDGAQAVIGEVREDNPWLRTLVRREGAIALDFPYFQPSLGGNRHAVPLVLYYQPLRRQRTSLGAAEVRKLLYTMWRRAYRIPRPLSNPEFKRMLRSLKARRRVGQRRLVSSS